MGLAPDAFWALSLAEWRWLIGPAAADGALTRAGLQRLIDHYPDEKP